jgi:hypothetical protein
MGNENNAGATESALIDLELLEKSVAKYFNFPNGVLPSEQKFSFRYFNLENFYDYVTHFLKSQNYEDTPINRGEYTPSSVPPALADATDPENLIYIFIDSPDFKPNGHFDQIFYKSTICHEACHAVSNKRTGFRSESNEFSWDEAATDYFGEQVSYLMFGEEFPFRTNYYSNDKQLFIPLRDQFGLTFNDDLNTLKDFYINGDKPGKSFKGFLDEPHLESGKSRRQFANNELLKKINSETAAIKTTTERYIINLRLRAKIAIINDALALYGLAPIDEKTIPDVAIRVYGRSRQGDFIAVYEETFPGASLTNQPEAFRLGSIIKIFDNGAKANNSELKNTVSTATVEAILEVHLQNVGANWIGQDPIRLRQLSALLANEITPTLGTKLAPLGARQPMGVELEVRNFKEYLSAQNIDFANKQALGVELAKSNAPAGWNTGTSPDLTQTGIYTEDTQYKNQIVIELSDNSVGGSVKDAARYLYQKHPGKTEWLEYNPGTRNLELIDGVHVDLPPESRIIVVGYGDDRMSTLGGLSAIELANIIKNKFGTSNSVQRISLVGCNVGETADYAGSLLQELNKSGKTVTDGVTARSSLVQVDKFGQKWVAVIDPVTNSVKEWVNGNDGSSKIKVTLDPQGQVHSAPVVNEDGELKRVDQFEPDTVSGELDRLRAMGLEGLPDVSIASIKYKVALLNDMGLVGGNGRISEQDIYALESANGDIEPSKICFDENIFGQFFSENHDAQTLHDAALLAKVVLTANNNDTANMFIGGNSLDSDSLAGRYTAAIKDMNSGWPGAEVFSTNLQEIHSLYQQQALIRQFEEKLSLSLSDIDTVSSLQRYAEQLVGVTADDLDVLRARFSSLTDAQLIEKVAIDSAQRSLRGHSEAEDVLSIGRWTTADADLFLSVHEVLTKSSDGSVINAAALHRLVNQGSALEHIRLVAALELVEPYVAKMAVLALGEAADPVVRDLGSVLADKLAPPGSRNADAISTIGGDALAVFTTLTSIQQIITNWNKLSSAQRGLDVTGIVGGLGTTSVASKAISSIFSQAGAALGDVGEAVKGSVLGLALAPVTFASIGLQWQDFWDNDGDTTSLSYRSLVASTVITTVTTAAGIALTGVSIAASLGAVAATSILGAIAASAGPIGVVIGAAAFLINGIVQGAMQIAQYDQDFDNVGDKVAQFFAAWVGVQTDGLLRAQARQEGKAAAEEQQKSLTEQWVKTKQYLSDVFSKDGYKYLTVSERTYAVTPAVVSTTGHTYSYLLQASETYASNMPAIVSNSISTGSDVWSELGDKPTLELQGLPDDQHMFNLDDNTKLKTLIGGNKNNVFNLSRDAQVGALIGGEGDDTLMWQAGNVRAPSHIVSVVIDTKTGKAYARDTEINGYLQQFSVSKIENFSVVANGDVEIHANDAANHILEAMAARGKLFGGTGTNTFVLNDQTYAYSVSNDLFLWKEGATAYIGLTPDATRLAMADGSQLLPASNDKQVAFVELPFSYADMNMSRDSYSLKLFAPDGNILSIDNVFGLAGDLNKKKVVQLRDKDSREFSLNIPGLLQDAVPVIPLANMPKAFVFRNSGAADRSSSHVLHLHGDSASNSYSFEDACGHFVVTPQTSQYMTLLLDVDVKNIQYSYAVDGSMALSRTGDNSNLLINIQNYLNIKGQLVFYAKNKMNSGSADAEWSFVKLVLPTWGTGTLGESNIYTSNVKDDALKFPGDETAHGSINLSGDTLNHWVSDAISAPNLNIQSIGQLTYLRQGNDLIMYDAKKLDRTYGLMATTWLKIFNFFDDHISVPNLKINQVIVSGSSIKSETTTFQGTIEDDNIRLPGTITNFIGGDGAGQYEIDMSIAQTYTIDNMADDGIYDSLNLHGVSDVAGLTVTANGSDVIIANTKSSITLKGYLKDAYRRHIFLRVNNGDSAPYIIPSAIGGGIDYYEIDPRKTGQQVHIFNTGKGNIIDIGEGAGPYTVTIQLPLDISNYTKTVIGNDLKLAVPDDSSFIYLANYYDFPKATSITWSNQDAGETVVLPDNWHQNLLDAGVPRDWVVRYVNAGLNAPADAKTALAYQNNTYLQKVKLSEVNSDMQRGVTMTAFIPLSIPAFGNMGFTTIFGNRPDSAGTGFNFSIDNAGNLVLKANAADRTSYDQILRERFVTAGENTALLFTYIPRSRDLYVWKLGNDVPLYARDLGATFDQAWRQGSGFYSNSDSAVSACYIGNPKDISDNVGTSFTTSNVDGLTGPTSPEIAKSIYRVQGVPGLTDETITALVDGEKLVSLEQINEAVAYLDRGVMDVTLIRELVDDVHNPILATDINVDVVDGLRKENATSLFIFNALKENLGLTDAVVYLRCGVEAEEVREIKWLLESKGPAVQSIMEKALIILGYNKATAQLLSPILAPCGLRKATQAALFINEGFVNSDVVVKYINAGVSVEDLLAGNSVRDSYGSGDRRKLISVSVSDSLAQKVFSPRYYLNQDYTDSGGYTLKAGRILDAGALKGPDSVLYVSINKVWDGDGMVSQFRDNSTPDNLIDGKDNEGDAWAWSWLSPLDSDGNAKKLSLANGGDPASAGWIRFDLKDKIALTRILLKGKGGDGTALNLKAQAMDGNGGWRDISQSIHWTPGGNSICTIDLYALDLPYDAYRIAIQQGDLPINLWLTEVDFSSKSLL